MMYILGGASRSGKTLLSRRAVLEKGIPYFPIDALVGGLVNGLPELGLVRDQAFVARAEKMWPVLKPTLEYLFEEEGDFLIEGDSILPKQVDELTREGKATTSCFLGYTELTAEDKLALVRTYHQGDADWTKDIPDHEMSTMIDEMIEFSSYLQGECAKYQIPYFDISHSFEDSRERAFRHLFAQ